MEKELGMKLQFKGVNAIRKIAIVLMIVLLFSSCSNIFSVQAQTVQPLESQYLEMRAVEVKDVQNEGKQVIFELWAHDLEFRGFDVRFTFDGNKYETSNINTNESTDDETEFFIMEDEFQDDLSMMTLPEGDSIVRAIYSVDGSTGASTYINNMAFNGRDADVLIGKMSFKVKSDSFNIEDFSLLTDVDSSPVTGIKININVTNAFENQSTFRFTDKTAAPNLSSLVLSTGVYDDDPEVSTYKEYNLDPAFDTETYEYDVTLLDYKNTLDVTAVPSDPTCTMKVRVPKRDDDGKLEYEDDGTTIKYEEKELVSDTPTEVTINKLGEPDTVLTVIVTTADGNASNEYEVTINRPYGTIRGSIQLGESLREEMELSYGVHVKYVANCTLYRAGEFDWDGIVPKTTSLFDLDSLENFGQFESDEEDGSYVIYAAPGSYDLIIERLGFLADVTTTINIEEGTDINLGHKILIDGDTDRTGIIDLDDMINAIALGDSSEGDGIYAPECDFGQKGFISLDDYISTIQNGDKLITITELNN